MNMKKINWAKVRGTSVNLVKSILRGDIVLKLDRFLPHILVVAGLCALCIYVNLRFDQTMVEREQNRKALEQVKVCYSQKVCQLAEIRQVNNVVEMLASEGVDVAMPQKPARIIRRK